MLGLLCVSVFACIVHGVVVDHILFRDQGLGGFRFRV